jgi:Asp-tRNA(Asn)/Glu-tRNA(Gln) amidotransferase B subunit
MVARRRELIALGVAPVEAEIITRGVETAALFDAALEAGGTPRGVANWVVHELPREVGGTEGDAGHPVRGAELGKLVALVEAGTLSSSAGREVLREMVETAETPEAIVERRGLRQVSDPEMLFPIITAVVAEHAGKAKEYREGRTGLLGFFVGQVMRRTAGTANPEVVSDLLERALQDG